MYTGENREKRLQKNSFQQGIKMLTTMRITVRTHSITITDKRRRCKGGDNPRYLPMVSTYFQQTVRCQRWECLSLLVICWTMVKTSRSSLISLEILL